METRIGNKLCTVLQQIPGKDQFGMPTYCYRVKHHSTIICDKPYLVKKKEKPYIFNVHKSAIEL